MGASDLPEMYACSPWAMPSDFGHTFQANHKCPCYSYYVTANSLNANASTSSSTGFFICIPEGYAASNIAKIVRTSALDIPESPVDQILGKVNDVALFKD